MEVPLKKRNTSARKKTDAKSRVVTSSDRRAEPKKKIVAAAKVSMSKKVTPLALKDNEASEARAHHDIISLILDDHKPLKRLIRIMKDTDATVSVRRSAFNEFASLLIIHAKSEEHILYAFQRENIDMRTESFEGNVEHALADQLVDEVKQTMDKDLWSARVKVLAELVEHHIQEEEDEIFPELKKCSESADRIRLGEDYLTEKEKIKMDVVHPAVRSDERISVARH